MARWTLPAPSVYSQMNYELKVMNEKLPAKKGWVSMSLRMHPLTANSFFKRLKISSVDLQNGSTISNICFFAS